MADFLFRNKWLKKEALRYALFGFIFGCCFPVCASIFDLIRLGEKISFQNLILIQIQNPIHLIIDTAPIFLGIFALIGGIKQDILIKKNLEILEKEKFKQEFYANISHEIRTPMNGIIGMIDLLKNTSPSLNKQKKYLDVVSKSSNDLIEIINDILDYSKLEAGELSIQYSTNSLQVILSEEIELFKNVAKEQNNTIYLNIKEEIPSYLRLGQTRIRQIVRNLLSNAIKFTKNGTISIEASLLSYFEKDCTIKIKVIDDGKGIKEEDQSRLFNVFQQLDQNQGGEEVGTGLGLSIVKKLSELMGGKVGVESQLSIGSNFWFTFNAQESEQPKEVKQIVPKMLYGHKNRKILVVDDNDVNLLVAKTMLAELGYDVVTANNGFQAVESLRINTYDLILMDIQMPEMDGITATQKIKKMEKKSPPIIALTASVMEGDREKFLSAGLDDYITKPIKFKTLEDLTDQWLFDE